MQPEQRFSSEPIYRGLSRGKRFNRGHGWRVHLQVDDVGHTAVGVHHLHGVVCADRPVTTLNWSSVAVRTASSRDVIDVPPITTLVVGGGLLGVLLGAVVRASYRPRGWSASGKLFILLAFLPAVGVAVLLPPLPGLGSRLTQLYCYLASLLTGYIVTAMLEDGPHGESQGDLKSQFSVPEPQAPDCALKALP